LKKITNLITIFLSFGLSSLAQEASIEGKVVADEDLEGIHIINKTSNKFTITNERGIFVIPAKLNDTILISSIQYMQQEIVVDEIIMHAKHMNVYLQEQIYELDQVMIGKYLIGDLRSDILNTEIRDDINFYDVGIPGYTGKPLTQNERRLFEADHGKMLTIFKDGLININIHKILNRISGRTKKLKLHVRLEKLDECMNRAKSDFSESIFGGMDIEETLIIDFFYYASEDPGFYELCQHENQMEMFQYLIEKLTNYEENLEKNKD